LAVAQQILQQILGAARQLARETENGPMHQNEAELREMIMRYRVMEEETSDPIAVRLLHDIITDLETELGDRNQAH
jgi:hypothetical protein